MKVSVEISPGEFFDKFTILINKIYYCKKPMDVTLAMIQLIELSSSFSGMQKWQWLKIHQSLLDLRDINQDLWDLEELARSPTLEQIADPLKVWKAIRDQNQARSKVKNNINDILDALPEVKDYATKTE